MNNKWYMIFNYGTIALVFVLAVFLIIDMARGTYEIIPREYYLPLVAVLFIIFILRIIARFYFMKKSNNPS